MFLSARSSLADHYQVPTGSMMPTVEIGDRIAVNKAAYGLRVPFTNTYFTEFSAPARGDVVVLESPREEGLVLLKRVVATPGDVVQVRAGRIWLDGEPAPLDEHSGALVEQLGSSLHEIRLDQGGGQDFGPVLIPENSFLVMGDNRGQSLDGRLFGLVDRQAILGRAAGVYWRHGLVWRDL